MPLRNKKRFFDCSLSRHKPLNKHFGRSPMCSLLDAGNTGIFFIVYMRDIFFINSDCVHTSRKS